MSESRNCLQNTNNYRLVRVGRQGSGAVGRQGSGAAGQRQRGEGQRGEKLSVATGPLGAGEVAKHGTLEQEEAEAKAVAKHVHSLHPST